MATKKSFNRKGPQQRAFAKLFLLVCGLLLAVSATARVESFSVKFIPSLLQGLQSVGAAPAQAQKASPDGIWQTAEASQFFTHQEARQNLPQAARTVRLNREALAVKLSQAPLEFTEAAGNNPVELTLPLPDGGFARFQIEESPVMEPGLARQLPQFKSYRGRGLDDPAATTRFSLTPDGFQAIILARNGAVYLDPYATSDTGYYLSYNKRDYRQDGPAPRCSTTGSQISADNLLSRNEALRAAAAATAEAVTYRTFILALAATGEYVASFAPPGSGLTARERQEKALAAMVKSVDRVNAIFERDLAIHLNLSDDEFKLIFTDPARDPYTNGDEKKMMVENASFLGCGRFGYHVGHVLGTQPTGGGAGYAWISSVCDFRSVPGLYPDSCVSYAARGASISVSPKDDSFDVDLFAHELGHQFGAEHTFNGTAGNCGGNRVGGSAYEPGSGSTIMAYAGACTDATGSQDVQGSSDPYFHARSIQQINSYVSGLSCAVTKTLSNHAPIMSAKEESYTIPMNTPFTLEALAYDSDGDFVQYCWEEYDLGDSSKPGTDHDLDGVRPIFRSYLPSDESARTFPRLDYILNNANAPPLNAFEALPRTERTMKFRVTGRDNRGGVGLATTTVKVRSDKGPFRVTSPNTKVNWTPGSLQTVTWAVAGTDTYPVSTGSVKILLSVDGGRTFSVTLYSGTVNSGSAGILVPAVATSKARIKVAALGNIFFDISDADFTICSASPVVITRQPDDQVVCSGARAVFSVGATGSSLRYQWSKDGKDLPGQTESFLALDAVSAADVGSYQVKVAGSCAGSGAVLYSKPVKLTLHPTLSITSQPKATAVCVGRAASFSVTASGAHLSYHWRKNGVPLPGANTTTFSLAAVSVADAGDYDVLVSSACGSLISQKARLTINEGVTITGQPVPVTAREGQPAIFSVTATGANLRYQWRRNGSNLAGATAASYNIAAVSTAHTGRYSVIVSNDCESEISYIVELTVNTAIAITSQPANATRCVGQQAAFAVTATGADLRYQWRGPDGGNIPGATASSYIIPAVSAAHAGSYYVVVYNGGGQVNSAKATLTVHPAMNISPASQSFPASGGSGSVAVSGSGCAWTAVSNAAWLKYLSGGGTGNGTVAYTVAANTGPPRSGTLTIAGKTFTVMQQGATN